MIRRSLALACVCALTAAMLGPAAQGAGAQPLGHAGRWLTDAGGRVVIVHGINMVYKVPPYYPAAAGFGADDATFLQRIGFDAVRVGVIWKALEPKPGVYDDAYLTQIARTVRTLAARGIFSLLDFHQDMFNELFQGEGAPDWAVQDDGLANPKLGFSGNYTGNAALQRAFDHFWDNSPGPGGVGLEDRFAAAWRHVALRFRDVPSVLGYELFNEPWPGTDWAPCVTAAGCPAFDAKLTAFNRKVAAAIRTVDRHTLIFYEPNVLFDFGYATNVGALDDGPAGFAFHDYCLTLSADGCPSEATGFTNALGHVASTGEALLLTEFGSNPFAGDLSGMVRRADAEMVPWLEWSFCPCHDPTGPTTDPLVLNPFEPPVGSNLGQLALHTLVEPYPQAIAGTPKSWGFDPATRTFGIVYLTSRADRKGAFPAGSVTEIATPPLIYGGRYGAQVSGGAVVSPRGAPVLRIASCRGATRIAVTVLASSTGYSSCRPPAT